MAKGKKQQEYASPWFVWRVGMGDLVLASNIDDAVAYWRQRYGVEPGHVEQLGRAQLAPATLSRRARR